MTKYLLIALLISLFAVKNYAQDVIVKKDGSTILSKVLEVNTNDVKYKKTSNLNGPTYTINKSDIISINYDNGEKDIFSSDIKTDEGNSLAENRTSQKFVRGTPSKNKEVVISKYNTPIQKPSSLKSSNKEAWQIRPVMSVSDSSLISTVDLEMRFKPIIYYEENWKEYFLGYNIELENKSNHIMYIDLANSFRIKNDSSYTTYYNTEQTTVIQGGNSGASVGLGGIANVLGIGGTIGALANSVSVGGSSGSSVMTTYADQRFLIIPPHGTALLAQHEQIYTHKFYKTIKECENWNIINKDIHKVYESIARKYGTIKRNQYLEFKEHESPYFIRYIVTYSPYQDFSTYSMLNTKVYLQTIIGVEGHYHEYSYNVSQSSAINNFKKYIQRYVPDFWDNSFRLVGQVVFDRWYMDHFHDD